MKPFPLWVHQCSSVLINAIFKIVILKGRPYPHHNVVWIRSYLDHIVVRIRNYPHHIDFWVKSQCGVVRSKVLSPSQEEPSQGSCRGSCLCCYATPLFASKTRVQDLLGQGDDDEPPHRINILDVDTECGDSKLEISHFVIPYQQSASPNQQNGPPLQKCVTESTSDVPHFNKWGHPESTKGVAPTICRDQWSTSGHHGWMDLWMLVCQESKSTALRCKLITLISSRVS